MNRMKMNWNACSLLVSCVAFLGMAINGTSLAAAQEDASLLGWYRFDGGQGETLKDSSRNGNAGKIYNAAWIKVANGYAMRFDGVHDYLEIPHQTFLALDKSFAIEFWVRTQYKHPGDLISKAQTSGYLNATLGTNGLITVICTGPGGSDSIIAPQPVNNGQWHHVVFYVDREKGVIGSVVDSTRTEKALNKGVAFSWDGPLCVGKKLYKGWFWGDLDELRIYGKALTDEEIKRHFAETCPGQETADAKAAIPESKKALAGYWPLDEGQGTLAFDKSSNSNNGAIKDGEWSVEDGKAALEFGAKPSSVLIVPSKPYYDFKRQFTAMGWIYPMEAKEPMNKCIMSTATFGDEGQGVYRRGYLLMQNRDRIVLWTGNAGLDGGPYGMYATSSDPVLKEKTWQLVACTYDADANLVLFYHNGEKANQEDLPSNGEIICPTNVDLSIGKRGKLFFDGFIRDVRLYNGALSPEEIRAEYQRSLPMMSSLKVATLMEKQRRIYTATLTGEVYDEETKAPLDVRMFAAIGKVYYFPEDTFNYGSSRFGHFYAPGKFQLHLPPGQIELKICRGFEYEVKKITVDLKDKEEKAVKIGLKNLFNMPQRNWYSSDHEVQFIGHSGTEKYQFRLQDIANGAGMVCRAEGLHHVLFVPQLEQYLPLCNKAVIPGFLPMAGRESGTRIDDDIVTLGVEKSPKMNRIFNLPMIEEVAKQGGLAIPTHIHSGSFKDTSNKLFSRAFPIYVTLGIAPIFNPWMGDYRNSTAIKDYYRFLNLGFKLGLSASTDIYFAHPTCSAHPGDQRTYLSMPQLTPAEVVKSYREGRTFITQGPLLILKVADKTIGDTIALEGGDKKVLNGEIEAHCWNGLETIEIVKNGETLTTIEGKGERDIKRSFQVEVDDTCWIAARCIGQKGELFGRFALTSPIYVQFGKNKLKPKGEDIQYFLKWMDDLEAFTRQWCKENPESIKGDSKEIVELLYKKIGEARKVFSALASSPRDFQETANP